MIPLFLDCQTTGMHPSIGSLLELAGEAPTGPRQFLLKLPPEATIPPRVSELTGITATDLERAVEPEIALRALEQDLGPDSVIVAHYAQFERTFLGDLYARRRGGELPWKFICTYKIAQRLYPEVPSRNIRALVGFFSLGSSDLRRASQHAHATALIWSKLGMEGKSREEIEAWLASTKAIKPARVEFRIDRATRLVFPEKPGVYRMLAEDGRVLYVGKATSLRSRVNSYFRGKKGQGKRKREMLSQVWKIEVTECASALEAALLENEEIKRLNPPYNTSLKTGTRDLRFFSRDLLLTAEKQNDEYPIGPFGRNNSLELLGEWSREPAAQIFHDEVEPETLKEGQTLFLARHGYPSLPSVRALVALGAWLGRALEEPDEGEPGEEEEDAADEAEEAPLTPEEAAERYEGLCIRAAWEYFRAKRLGRLLNCRVHLGDRVLELRGGRLGGVQPSGGAPWAGLGIADYDRMSVLLTEINRHAYPVESLPGA
ncbi:MAG: GIY-YIG nuclease family protein [Bdellovibrionota bacterium]